jgi:hypothetical protein
MIGILTAEDPTSSMAKIVVVIGPIERRADYEVVSLPTAFVEL